MTRALILVIVLALCGCCETAAHREKREDICYEAGFLNGREAERNHAPK